MRQRSRTNQYRGGCKIACPPATRLHAAAMDPFASSRPEIACALRAMRAPQFRGRDCRAALKFLQEIFPVRSAQGATTETRTQLQRPQRYKPANRSENLELVGRDDAYA